MNYNERRAPVNYRGLTVYKKARELVIGSDRLIKTFPRSPQADVIARQLFRAVTSINANIAEGKGKNSGREYLRYLTHAQGSANETDHWLRTAVDCGLASQEQAEPLLAILLEVLKILSAARATLARQIAPAGAPGVREREAPYAVVSYGDDAKFEQAERPAAPDFDNADWLSVPAWADPLELDNP